MKDGLVGEDVRLEGDDFGNGQRGSRGDGPEAPVAEFVDGFGHVAVGEAAAAAHGLQHEEDVVLLDEFAERGAGETFDVAAHVLRGVAASEEGGLTRGALGQSVDAEAGVNRL